MDDLKYLKQRASECFRGFETVMATLNKMHSKPGYRWEMDEDKGIARRIKLPEMTWEPFEEPNDPVYTKEEQELILRR
jgi:hypothetical protein